MKPGLFITGAVIAGGLSAAFLLDEKKGRKRRKSLEKKADHLWKQVSHTCSDYAKDLTPYWKKYSAQWMKDAKQLSEQGIAKAQELSQNGWSPSGRMLGAAASAVAFYGVGRNGVFGGLLRTVSLGLLLRALFASK